MVAWLVIDGRLSHILMIRMSSVRHLVLLTLIGVALLFIVLHGTLKSSASALLDHPNPAMSPPPRSPSADVWEALAVNRSSGGARCSQRASVCARSLWSMCSLVHLRSALPQPRSRASRVCFAAAAAVARDAARTADLTALHTPLEWPEYRAAVRDRIAVLADADTAHWHGAVVNGMTGSVAVIPADTAANGSTPGKRQVRCALCYPVICVVFPSLNPTSHLLRDNCSGTIAF